MIQKPNLKHQSDRKMRKNKLLLADFSLSSSPVLPSSKRPSLQNDKSYIDQMSLKVLDIRDGHFE